MDVVELVFSCVAEGEVFDLRNEHLELSPGADLVTCVGAQFTTSDSMRGEGAAFGSDLVVPQFEFIVSLLNTEKRNSLDNLNPRLRELLVDKDGESLKPYSEFIAYLTQQRMLSSGERFQVGTIRQLDDVHTDVHIDLVALCRNVDVLLNNTEHSYGSKNHQVQSKSERELQIKEFLDVLHREFQLDSFSLAVREAKHLSCLRFLPATAESLLIAVSGVSVLAAESPIGDALAQVVPQLGRLKEFGICCWLNEDHISHRIPSDQILSTLASSPQLRSIQLDSCSFNKPLGEEWEGQRLEVFRASKGARCSNLEGLNICSQAEEVDLSRMQFSIPKPHSWGFGLLTSFRAQTKFGLKLAQVLLGPESNITKLRLPASFPEPVKNSISQHVQRLSEQESRSNLLVMYC
ncbi:MAG: hypothetical protein KDD60_01865 [Bdellovibrionales bacterium]|nr:hypothetical protein [Bdellovibrionales bacterium]